MFFFNEALNFYYDVEGALGNCLKKTKKPSVAICSRFSHIKHKFTGLYFGIEDMVKDHSDTERGNLLPPLHGLLFLISSKGSFICTHPTDRITHTTTFVTPVVEHWLEMRNSSMGPLHEESI